MYQRRAAPFDSCTFFKLSPGPPMNNSVRQACVTIRDEVQAGATPWAMQLWALSADEPGHLVQTLTGAILGCGGWVLSRSASDAGLVSLLFEFERRACMDIYSVLIGAGLELSQSGHLRLTDLCQCTRLHPLECGEEIASIDIEIQTSPVEVADTRAPLPV